MMTGKHGHDDDEEFEYVVDEREAALRRLRLRRRFVQSVAGYAVVCGVLIAIWALGGGGYFWPVWVLAIWGALLLLQGWKAFFLQPITNSDVDEEVRRRAHGHERR